MASFTEKLEPAALEFFNEICAKSFQDQAMAFLNAYWPEVGSQAEFIYHVSWERIKYADMEAKGISLLYQYEEGNDLDFDIGLYFYEQLCKRVLDDPKEEKWRGEEFALSQPEMMTALKRKQELRDKVDVNFDNRISFLEYLLYQYREVANPADFCKRSMTMEEEHPEIRAARLALEEVNKRIQAYEAEKARLEAEAEGTGVKALRAKNMLAQLGASPLWESLQVALIQAEAALRRAQRLYGAGGSATTGADGKRSSYHAGGDSQGALWWMQKDLDEKKAHYGR